MAVLLEVVDKHNTPLCLMSERDVLGQKLKHRAVALLLRDKAGRALFTQRQGYGWDFSSYAVVYAGQAYEAVARTLLQQDWHQGGRRLTLLGVCPAHENGARAFTAVYEVRMPVPLLSLLAADRSRHLLLDHDEIQGLERSMSEMFSPLLRYAMQEDCLSPHIQLSRRDAVRSHRRLAKAGSAPHASDRLSPEGAHKKYMVRF